MSQEFNMFRYYLFIVVFCWGVTLSQETQAQTPTNAKANPQTNELHALHDTKDLQKIRAFIDEYNAEHAEESHTVGWTFAFAQGGTLNKKQSTKQVQSFGVRDVKTREAINGNTVFRIASVSKVFVSVAVQQLLEQQLVALDNNISEYLSDFSPLDDMAFPITLRNLLTHTAGFEDKFYGDSARSKDQTQSLDEHLAEALPKQIHQPGEIIRYSNYGNALAALVVEKVSGLAFHQYVQQHILTPAGMVNSGYILTEKLKNLMATGYRHKDGELQARPYTWVHRYPPTSMLTTGNDMSRFIAMLLGGGMGENGRVLNPESVQQMFSTQFTHDEDIPGMALGWMEFQRYGNQALFHDGATPGFVAELVIIPEENAGYFIAANQKGSGLPGDLRYDFLEAFFDQPFIKKNNTDEFDSLVPELPLDQYAGKYQNTRRNHSSYEAFAVLMSNEVDIQPSDSGNGLLHWNREYLPYTPHKFVHAESGHKLVFKVKNNMVQYLTLDWGGAPRAYKKLDFWQYRNTQTVILAVIFNLSLLTVIIALGMKVKKRKRVLTEVTANALLVVFFVLLAAWSMTLDTVLIRLAEIDTLKVLLAMPIVALLILVMHIIQRKFHWLRLLAMTPVVAALLWLQQYNLLGWWFY